jgi:hypothetical protein
MFSPVSWIIMRFGCFLLFTTVFLKLTCKGEDFHASLNAPIGNFVLPIFNEDGYKTWETYGTSAVLNNEGTFDINDVKLCCFTDQNDGTAAFVAVSEHAFLVPSSHMAHGDSKIMIVGKNFRASADTWKFFGSEKKIVAKNNVSVFLDCDVEEFWR